jgi:hypothetical protein
MLKNKNILTMVDLDGLYQKSSKGALHEGERICHVFYPWGKPRIPHLLCCQGFAVIYYSFTLDASDLPAGRDLREASSTFASIGSIFGPCSQISNNHAIQKVALQSLLDSTGFWSTGVVK